MVPVIVQYGAAILSLLRLLSAIQRRVHSSVGVGTINTVDLRSDSRLDCLDGGVVSFLRSRPPEAILLGADNGLRECHTEGECVTAPVRSRSKRVATRPSIRSGNVVGVGTNSALESADVDGSRSSAGLLTVGVGRANHISDRVIADAAPDTVPSRLRTIVTRRSVTFDGLESPSAKVLLNKSDVIRPAAIPVVDDDVSGSSIVNRYEVSVGVLADLVDGVVSVKGETSNSVNLPALVQTHADKEHAPPNRVGRSSKPLLTRSSGPVSSSFGSRVRVVWRIVSNPRGCSSEDLLRYAHFITSIVWDTRMSLSSIGSVPMWACGARDSSGKSYSTPS
nr:MAG TPA: hypothetical protein [Caudoviricetes sp.]